MTKKRAIPYKAWEDNELHQILCDYFPAHFTRRKKLDVITLCQDLGWCNERLYKGLRGRPLSSSTIAGLLTLCARYDNAELLAKANRKPEELKPLLLKFESKGRR